jgi:hypothetical protein
MICKKCFEKEVPNADQDDTSYSEKSNYSLLDDILEPLMLNSW